MRALLVAFALFAASAGAAAALHLPGGLGAPPATSSVSSALPSLPVPPGTPLTLDFIAEGDLDTIHVVAFRADTASVLSYTLTKDFGGLANDFCNMEQLHVGGSAAQLRALGLGLPLPASGPLYANGGGGTVHSPDAVHVAAAGVSTPAVASGVFSFEGGHSDTVSMDAGDYLLVAFGYAGSVAQFSPESQWSVRLESTGDLTMETLPDAPMECGSGFDSLDGATVGAHVLGVGTQFGGDLALSSPYGMAAYLYRFSGLPAVGTQDARLTMAPGTWDVDGIAEPFWHANLFAGGTATLEVERWDGDGPAWVLQGFPDGLSNNLPPNT